MKFETSELHEVEGEQDEETITGGGFANQLGPDEGIFFKFGSPLYALDADWTVTLSRNDFPWHEIAFAPFTPRECYEKYISIVKEPHTFLKKVLGLKEKYKKMMEPQMQIMNTATAAVHQENPAVYCRCKGGVISELFVKCDGDQECPNGSWLHPQCTTDLRDKSKAELDTMEEWYCEDCQARISREEDEPANEDYEDGQDVDIEIDEE